jgi:hypothetical protein
MHIVPKTKDGEILWGQVFEVASLEDFAEQRESRMRELGVNNQHFGVMAPNRVEHWGEGGKVIMTYHLCTKERPHRLV